MCESVSAFLCARTKGCPDIQEGVGVKGKRGWLARIWRTGGWLCHCPV